jgi:hypothetical protein
VKRLRLVLSLAWAAVAAAQTPQYCPTSGCNIANLNSVISADSMTGGDIGAKINNAVVKCQALGFANCTITVQQSGVISTPPVIPQHYTLVFSPAGQYTLSTHWVMNHRDTRYNFNGAIITYTLNDGLAAIYVGKGITGVASSSGTTVTRVSGATFSTVDVGDQIAIDSGSFSPAAGNVQTVSSNSITTTGSMGSLSSKNFAVSMYAYPAALGGNGVTIRDLFLIDGTGTGTNMGLQVELASVEVYGYTASNFAAGRCLVVSGSVSGNYYGLHCNQDASGIVLDQNSIGGFWISTANDNRFFGPNITSCTTTGGHGTLILGGSQNQFYGLHEEGCQAHIVNQVQQVAALGYAGTQIQSYGNIFHVSDAERNGDNSAGAAEFSLLDSTQGTVIDGGPVTTVYTGSGSGLGTQYGILGASTTSQTHISDMVFLGPYSKSYSILGSGNCSATNVTPIGTTACSGYVRQPSGPITISGQGSTSGSYDSQIKRATEANTAGNMPWHEMDGPTGSAAYAEFGGDAELWCNHGSWGLCATANPSHFNIPSGAVYQINNTQIASTDLSDSATIAHVQSATSGSIGGGALTAGNCATGTATLGTSATGHPGIASASDGSVQGNYTVQVTTSGTTATVSVCAITAGTPTAKTYSVKVF